MSTDSEHDSELEDLLEESLRASESEADEGVDDNSEELGEEVQGEMRVGIGERLHRNLILRDFYHLIAGPRFNVQETAADNTGLVNTLKELNVIKSQRVERAMLTCTRGTFIPPEYSGDAYFDAPIRVEDMEFNISAPHMHATCLEALELQPGEKFLDVGSGCGIVAACGAYLVGRSGECVAAEIKQQIIDFSISCLEGLREDSETYVQESCEIQFLLHNAFIPSSYKDYFDKIHVGGTCPEDKLPNLIRLLKLDGGKMTVPVGHELRLITRRADGRANQRVLTQVRFMDLQVPTDVDIILSTLKMEREEKMSVQVPPSTLQADSKLVRSLSESLSYGSHNSSRDVMEISPSARKIGRSFSDFFGFRSWNGKKTTSAENICSDLLQFAEPDCALMGENWKLSAHKAVLKGATIFNGTNDLTPCSCVVRCEYFRARFDSEMQDSEDSDLAVPSQFSQEVMSHFLHYIYKDDLPSDLDTQNVLDILHVACYYGVPRLIVLCESLLAEELKARQTRDPEGAAEFSAVLLTLADSNGLSSLQTVVLQYIAEHFDLVSETKTYSELSKREVDMIMKESFQQQQNLKKMLSDLSALDKSS